MKISHIEHVGIAVTSLEEAIPFYENMLGLKCYAVEEVADQKVKTAPESAIAKFIEKNGGRGGIQHVAFCVEDGVAGALNEVQEKGGRVIDAAPRRGAEGLNIGFLHPKTTAGALIELCEHPEK